VTRRLAIVVALAWATVACAQAPAPGSTAPAHSGHATTRASAPTTTAPATAATPPTASAAPEATLAPLRSLAYEETARLDFPIQLVPAPGGVPSLLALKDGRVFTFDGAFVGESPLLDIGDRVRNRGEQGLLSIATHPDDANRLFAHYSALDGDTVVAEFSLADLSGAPPRGPPAEKVLLRLDQPASNHNGGMIQFGPDGALYLGLGDGGGANDAYGHGQDRDSLLGGLVRIDVDGGGEPELFQHGLRNPWRFWIDGDAIYVADVGQGSFEEITVAPFRRGVNHGWPITEGLHCFRPTSGCDTAGITLPVVEVRHGDAGACSITGGVVYRGAAIPELDGAYLFSDYCGGFLRALVDGEVIDYTEQVGDAGSVVSFGVDGSGEVYVLTTERVLKLVPTRG